MYFKAYTFSMSYNMKMFKHFPYPFLHLLWNYVGDAMLHHNECVG